ncbi:tail fiber protein [Bacillus phage SP-10]|uniref:tail fiber protein n=1 Tax=Bacillus phage SP10 TaxID=941058 RepID=UPI0002198B6E|nr:tail fiber protein [Bacillus phage SP-10]BAK52966.1 tail fiber protein [Bacillus phage SP-10]
MDEIRLQSSLGGLKEIDRPDMQMSGLITVAKVLKVHHKSGTADVVVVNTKDTFTSSEQNEGKFAARILTEFAGYDAKREKYWGSIAPIAEGSLVLLGFLDNLKNRPVILGQFHRPDETENVLPSVYPLREKKAGYNRREALKSLTVYPSMAYKKVDGDSNMEFAHASKSFFAAYNTATDVQEYITDDHGGFDHQNLSEMDRRTGNVLEADQEEAQSPSKFLFVHRSSFDNEETTWTKFFLEASGAFRLTRDNNDGKLTYMEFPEEGGTLIRRQLDTNIREDATDYAELDIDIDGGANLRRVIGESIAEVGVNSAGNVQLTHSDGSYMDMGKDITIETDGEILSEALIRFIEKHFIKVGDEPVNPLPYTLWVDMKDE